MLEHRRLQAVQLRRKGLLVREIAEIMCCKPVTVTRYLCISRKQGINVEGDVSDAFLRPLSQDVRSWLNEITPKNSSAGDMIRAIIQDAYYDYSEKKDG